MIANARNQSHLEKCEFLVTQPLGNPTVKSILSKPCFLFTEIPETSVPQVTVIKSKKLKEGGSTGKAACLARNFLTKDISLEMPSQEVVYEQSTSIWTSEGLYNAIKVVNVTKDTEVTCTAKSHNSTITTQPGTVWWHSCHLLLETVACGALSSPS